MTRRRLTLILPPAPWWLSATLAFLREFGAGTAIITGWLLLSAGDAAALITWAAGGPASITEGIILAGLTITAAGVTWLHARLR